MNGTCLMGVVTFVSLYPALIIRSTSAKGKMFTISDQEAPWKIPLVMSTFLKAVLPDANTVLQ